jgi:hypothetical protein
MILKNGNKMLSFLDCRLWVIKQVHDDFMGGLYIIISCDFYKAPLVWNSWIFRPKLNGLDILETKFWNEHVKCYELKESMRQNNTNFINIVNQFKQLQKIMIT